MLTATGSTIQSYCSSVTPPRGLLGRLRALKGPPALAFFGALLTLCVVLVAALLVYVFLSLTDKGHAVASPPSVTPDDDDERRTRNTRGPTSEGHNHEGTAKNGSIDSAAPTDGASVTVSGGARHHTETFPSAITGDLHSGGASTLYESSRRLDTDVSSNTTGITGLQDYAGVDAGRTKVGEIAMMEALVDLEVQSDAVPLQGVSFDSGASAANFTNNNSAAFSSSGFRQDVLEVLAGLHEELVTFETPTSSNGSDNSGRRTPAVPKVAFAENSTGTNYTDPSDAAANYNASVGALTNGSQGDFIRSRTKDAHALPANTTAQLKYAVDLGESKPADQVPEPSGVARPAWNRSTISV